MIECHYCNGKENFVCVHELYISCVNNIIQLSSIPDFQSKRTAKLIVKFLNGFQGSKNSQYISELTSYYLKTNHPDIYKIYLIVSLLQ